MLSKISRLLTKEKAAVDNLKKTREAKQVAAARQKIVETVRAAGQTKDPNTILEVERALIQTDLAEYITSSPQKSSMATAMDELTAAEKTLPLVTDQERYRQLDASHGHTKARSGGLPKDDMRLFLSSQSARLLNMDKSRLSAEEKEIIKARRDNLYQAEKSYKQSQRLALGLPEPEQSRSRGRER